MRGSLLLAALFFSAGLWAQLNYQDVAEVKGIDHWYISALLGGGVSFYDFNQDGWDDITLATAFGDPIEFYQNMGGHFEQIPSLVPTEDESKQVLWVDFDNDGDLDLFVATWDGLNRLYEQTAEMEFTDITLEAGLPSFNTRTYGANFADYDRDGWLDLYFGDRIAFSPIDNRHYLFRNNGNKTFTDVTLATATQDTSGVQFCSGFFDYNQDGWPDIYTAHDRVANPNVLLENQANGTFRDVSEAANANLEIEAMSVTVGDYDRDGLFDVFCSNVPLGSKLLHNEGPDSTGQYHFAEVADASGVAYYGFGWGAIFFDADNDADQDLYISCSTVGSDVVPSELFLNEDDGTFSYANAGFVGDTVQSHNNAVGDFNADGYPDIMVINLYPFKSQLWVSPPLDNNWVKFDLEGVLSNRDGVGARLECFVGGQYQQFYTQCGNGFMGQNTGIVTFGMGAAETVDSLIVHWPSGHIDRLYELPANMQHYLKEGGSTAGDIIPDPQTGLEPIIITRTDETPPSDLLLQAYPSPTKDWLHIITKVGEAERYQITNAKGQLLIQGEPSTNGQTALDVRTLPAGVYYLTIYTTKGQQKSTAWYKD